MGRVEGSKIGVFSSARRTFVVQRRVLGVLLLFSSAMTSSWAQSPAGKAPLPNTFPTWPQQFALTAPAQAAFGFMVTQPGAVAVDVATKGVPVTVTLLGPAKQPVQQSGTGNLRLNYTVSAEELQRGLLWTLQITAAAPGNGAQAAGSIVVREPPIDPKVVENAQRASVAASAQLMRARPEVVQSPQLAAALRSSLIASVQQRQARFEQIRQQPIAQEYARITPYFQQAQAKAQQLPQPSNPVSTPAAQTMRLPTNAIPLPPVSAVSISLPHGTPGTPLLISGSAFGKDAGEVHFLVGAGLELVAKIDQWNDNQIFTSVPDANGVPGISGGHVFVVRGSDKARSNNLNFQFDPHLTLRFITATADQTLVWPYEPINSGGVAHSSYNPFAGFSGVDVLLGRTALRNGWQLADPGLAEITCGAIRPGDNQVSNCDGSVALLPAAPGSLYPKSQVLWSLKTAPAFGQARLAYMFSIGIVGPVGTADGVVCVQLPCDGFPNPTNSSDTDIMNQLSKAADAYAQLLQATSLN
jgi:IPT/TIG domain